MPQPPRPRRRRLIIWSVTAGASAGAAILIAGWWTLRPTVLKPHIEAALSHHLKLDVTIGHLGLVWRPRPRVTGESLAFRIPNRPDLPPFISIDHFSMDVGVLSALRKHVSRVHLDGMTIVVPPKPARGDLDGGDITDTSSIASKIVIDHLDASGTILRFMPKHADHAPLEFQIHELEIDALGFRRQMPFHTTLTNPIPEGLVESSGTFGPWPDDPTELPVSGVYSLTNSDLDTIDGIGGRLTSTGKYAGRLPEITVSGTTASPDFSLDLGGSPVPLHTSFDAAVDATNGTVRLDRVDATLRSTAIHATGLIKNLPGPAGHALDLDVAIADGRLEDVLRLASDAKAPLATGRVSMRSTLSLPPGHTTPVRQRLKLSGSFTVTGATFSGAQIQQKLKELSRRSRGMRADAPQSPVVTNMRGQFTFARSRLAVDGLAFHVPGATVDLGGDYTVDDGALDFTGTLTMQATVSQAMGGIKSWLLKPFDPLFRKNGAGAVVPITVNGTKDAPRFGLDMGRVFSRGK